MITLHIECYNNPDNIEELKELGIEIEDLTEFRPFKVNPEHIIGFYPAYKSGCIMFIGGNELVIQESFEEIEKLLQ